ncbi:helix-turn-helix domain-containing protein [Streptomyces sp. NPDC058286]|uniref:helix-turn-helix domain-containing protein n=1 Tax=Streptomyces sp. NPDC058286 TaxID=3346422 RepID=UPI0036EDA916
MTPPETGRPGIYCGTKCRQTANRVKKSRPKEPDTRELDEQLVQDLQAVQDEVEDLLGSLAYSGAPPEDPLRYLVRIQNRLDALTPGLVGRARAHNVNWTAIGTAMSLNADTVRHKYATGLERYQHKRTGRSTRPGGPGPRAQRNQAGDDGIDSAPLRPHDQNPETSVPAPGDELAPVLSALQRGSGQSLRAIADQARLSPGYLSRILAGERIPSWPAVTRIARTCGTSPAELRPLWEAARARGTKKEAPTLQAALRYLHQRAGHRDPVRIAFESADLTTSDITELLEGTTVLPWERVQQLVFALDGEVSYFEPLWQTAAQRAEPLAGTHQALQPDPSGSRMTSDSVFRLLSQFGDVLRSGPRLTPRRTASVRRTLIARIHAPLPSAPSPNC